MPLLQNAKKALRSSKRKEKVNQTLKSKTRTLVKKAKLEPTAERISAAFSTIDKSVKKNLMHQNKAARVKSSLSKLFKEDKTERKTVTKKTASTKATVKKKTAKTKTATNKK